jgi:hypothetical protein
MHMSSDAQVAKHYTRGRLEETIFRALQQAGLDLEILRPADLAPLDEFHVGGIVSTQELAAQMELRPNLHLLDVGSGLAVPPATVPRNIPAGSPESTCLKTS